MRLETRSNNTETHGELSSAHFGISAKDQVKIVTILRDALYSDKIMAVLREYGANAWDAQIMGGKGDEPFKVVLPSKFNPVLSIRDFGPGISEEHIYDIYCKYGSSTKDSSNGAVGMFGIGCKSGFAYCDAFTVVSYHNGTKSTYSAVVDDTQLGQMTKLAEEPTNETGIEIQVPVRMADVEIFIRKAKELFKHFEPQPIINCSLPAKNYTRRGTGWALRQLDGQGAYAIMGNIGYPIDMNVMESHLQESEMELLRTAIDLRFPIGALDIAASREQLQYKDKTFKAIRGALIIAGNELSKEIEAQFQAATTIYEKRQLYHSMMSKGSRIRDRRTGNAYNNMEYTLARRFRTRYGVDLDNWRSKPIMCNEHMEVRVVMDGKDSSIGAGASTRHNNVSIVPHVAIAMNDVKSGWVNRAVTLRAHLKATVSDWKGAILGVRFIGDDKAAQVAEYNAWIKRCNLQGVPVHKLSDHAPAVLSRGTAKRANNSKKTQKKVFKCKTADYQRVRSAPSDNWEAAHADLEEGFGIWIEIDRFRPKCDMASHLEVLKAVGVDTGSLTILGLRKKETTKLGPRWINFIDWYQGQLQNFVKANITQAEELLNIQAVTQYANEKMELPYRGRAEQLQDCGLDPKHPIVEFFNTAADFMSKKKNWTEADATRARLIYQAIRRLPDDKKPKASYTMAARHQEFYTAYPMLEDTRIFTLSTWNDNPTKSNGHMGINRTKRYVQYVQHIDTLKE